MYTDVCTPWCVYAAEVGRVVVCLAVASVVELLFCLMSN